MSKLLRLPLTLIAVLAALLFLPGVASGDPLVDCAAQPTAPECADAGGGDGGLVIPALTDQTLPGSEEEIPGDPGTGGDSSLPPVVGAVGELPDICTPVPSFPGCPDAPDAGGAPLTCEQLAELLGATGCPDSVSCEQLADLLGITCPEGPPNCEALAALFQLEGCPPTPTSCNEFADLLGVDGCSDIPCIDTSQLPDEAEEGLEPLLDGLEQIGIKACPARPATGGGTPIPTRGTGGTPTVPSASAAQPPAQQVSYANCDDARAKGAAPIYSGQPGYRPELDSDSDGVGCEVDAPRAVAPSTAQPTGTLAYTGFDLQAQLTVAWTLLMAGSALTVLARRRA
jgi:hypothetical protein